ncbi:MAG: Transcriptional regulator MntR [Candidatus Aerophobetes bacterium ADurb.Bin490]|nr:MAG: Transcriptional regulator MntR [Candidatus Aerophobetes bacterium ADurb.Bin490]HPI02681.1 metal-dependent transcriptional regulator [Candidatus Goldiibacteriota bacterium]HPN63844.1 metal-dependent transcriptional regulator [Candidatus Goldiibacteriota bacterium]HRQ43046.1 metal-dependent transcriptional regulator [Candidatus Goldiibacteriota bacterium]
MENKLSAAMADYLKIIYLLEKEKKVARVSDIGRRMEVRKASVVSAVNYLKRAELIQHERYGFITLTPRGRQAAEAINCKYEILLDFFQNTVKTGENRAKEEASKIQHLISGESTEKIRLLINALNKNSKVIKVKPKSKGKTKKRV